MNISMHELAPASAKAKRVLDMLEYGARSGCSVWGARARERRRSERLTRSERGKIGVSDAIERGYLRSVSFVIARDGKDEVVEEYKFNVKYGARGEIALDGVEQIVSQRDGASEHTGKTMRMERLSDAKYIKKAAVSMTRCLVSLVQTLEAIPESSTFQMHLSYVPNTPADYQPPFFEAANGAKEPTWERTPFSMSVGKVETQHHALSLRVKSVLDPAIEGESDETGKATGGSSQTSDEPLTPVAEKAPTHMSQEFVEQLSQKTTARDTPATRKLVDINDASMDALVLEWISAQKPEVFIDQVSCSKGLRAHPFHSINGAFERLLSRGVIAKQPSTACPKSGGFSLVVAEKATETCKSKALQPIPQNEVRKRLRSANK